MMTNEQATGTLEGIGQQDHSATSEYRIFGPPGTGKTTNLSRQIRRAVERCGSDQVLVTSFSRAAATELAGRDLPISPDRIGTLHSHCYRALGEPDIAEATVDEWNRRNPHLALTSAKKQSRLDGEEGGDDDSKLQKDGDAMLQQLSRCRGLMIRPESWPATVRQFATQWQEYKNSLGLLDFCDLIDVCLRDVSVAPGLPAVLFADEAQDLNRMQLTLIRKWGERADYFILAGDDDQTIYTFAGASPDAILDPDIPDDHKIILKQSHRVPRSVHRLAEALIYQVTRRQEKTYLPRAEEGETVRLSRGTYKSPEYFILKSAVEHLQAGKSVMFLSSCSYMLWPIVAVLKRNGIPFHNPYRKSNGFWNPLRLSRRGSSGASRILALLVAHPDFGDDHQPWTCAHVSLWAEWLQSKGILRHGAKEKLQSREKGQPVTTEGLEEIFEAGALESLLTAYGGNYRALLKWWRSRVMAQVHGRVQFPADIAAKYGPRALLEKPKVIVGTIRSVKGGQADVVYLFPDLSQAGDVQYQRCGPPRDSIIRLFYVGATRARETLYICQQESALAVRI
ncbi:MAG: ATP-dependent helicase [Acidobacteria bacterium]|nr:ATP-dependent helicase [Acidobacteriota bacterium]